MDIKKFFGIFFTLLGTGLLLFSAYAFLEGATLFGTEINQVKALIPTILGFIFFGAGVKFIR